MDARAQEIARRAAARLETEFGPGLLALVERELQHPGVGAPRYTGVETAIALAALLVSIAQFAWQQRPLLVSTKDCYTVPPGSKRGRSEWRRSS